MTKDENKQRPAFRINFAPRFEKDGKSQLGRSVEIGAAWKLEDDKGFRLSFSVVPQNLNDGAVFLNPVQEQKERQDAKHETEMELE